MLKSKFLIWVEGRNMLKDIKESDWKIFRHLREVALDRLCERILAEVTRLVADRSKTNHARYQELAGLLDDRDKDVADMFNGGSRSMALLQLLQIQAKGLLTAEEMAEFSPEAREFVRSGLDLR